MGIIRSDNFFFTNPKPPQEYERRYTGTTYVDWADTTELNAALSIEFRKNKYFWIDGIYYECDDDGVTYRAIGGPSAPGERFGIEDNTGVQDRNIEMDRFGLEINNISSFEVDNFNEDGDNNFFVLNDAIFGATAGDNLNAGSLQVSKASVLLQSTSNFGQPDVLFSSIQLTPDEVTFELQNDDTGTNNSTQKLSHPTTTGTYNIPLSVNGNLADSTGDITIPVGDGIKVAFAAPVATANTITVAALAFATTLVMVVMDKITYNAAVDDGNKVSFSGTTLDMTNAGGVTAGGWLIIFYL